MSTPSKTAHLYFSAHHLARDVFWNTANFTFFVLLGVSIFPKLVPLISNEISALSRVSHALSSPPTSVLVASYIALAVIVGTIAERLVAIASEICRFLPFPFNKLLYEGHYGDSRHLIEQFHERVFGDLNNELKRTNERGVALLVRLTAYFKIYNPDGYIHIFRTYLFVGLARQALAYLCLLVVYGISTGELAKSLFLLAQVGLTTVLLFFAVRHSVAREFAFLVATERWLLDQRNRDLSAP